MASAVDGECDPADGECDPINRECNPIDDSEYNSADSGTWKFPGHLTAGQLEKLYDDLGGQRLFTKERIRFMEEQLETLHREFVEFVEHQLLRFGGQPEKNEEIKSFSKVLTFIDAFGKEHQYKVPYDPWLYIDMNEAIIEPQILFYSYQALCYPYTMNPFPFYWFEEMFQTEYAPIPILPEPIPDTPHNGHWGDLAKQLIPTIYFRSIGRATDGNIKLDSTIAEQFREAWESKPERHAIIDAANKIKIPIKHIVCFGLGSLLLSTHPDIEKRAFRALEQHFGVFDMARKLRERSGKTFRILFQDPVYDEADKAYINSIADGFEIEFVKSPKGLYELTADTFVYCPGSPSFPIHQLVADLTLDFGGPAAVFWYTVLGARSRTMTGEKKVYTIQDELKNYWGCSMDPINRYVVDMLKGYTKVFDVDKVTRRSQYEGSSLYVKNEAATQSTVSL